MSVTDQLTEATTKEEIWEEIDDCFHAVHKAIENRSYSKYSVTGARYIQWLVRGDMRRIDYLLWYLDERAKKGHSKGKS